MKNDFDRRYSVNLYLLLSLFYDIISIKVTYLLLINNNIIVADEFIFSKNIAFETHFIVSKI